MSESRFITFEGGEGGGKSTQARRLVERLRGLGREVLATREPGGSPGAEALRNLLVTGPVERWSALSETLILYAARSDHLQRAVRPALESGAFVVCDRFYDSTRAYQGAAGGVDAGVIAALERAVVSGTVPALTVVLDLPAEDGLARAGRRGDAEARFEAKDLDFHRRLRAEFLAIARREPARCLVVDASLDPDQVELLVWAEVERRFQPASSS